jgi:hypothetical protein
MGAINLPTNKKEIALKSLGRCYWPTSYRLESKLPKPPTKNRRRILLRSIDFFHYPSSNPIIIQNALTDI